MIKPLNNYVLVEADDPENKTESGIILADNKEIDKPMSGKVVEVAEGVKEIKKGDNVIFHMYGPEEVMIDNKEYLLVSIEDITAIYEN